MDELVNKIKEKIEAAENLIKQITAKIEQLEKAIATICNQASTFEQLNESMRGKLNSLDAFRGTYRIVDMYMEKMGNIMSGSSFMGVTDALYGTSAEASEEKRILTQDLLDAQSKLDSNQLQMDDAMRSADGGEQ